MESAQVLDIVERLLNAAKHPDITKITRYGRDLKPGGQSPAGVAITYRSGTQAYLWATAPDKGQPEPHPFPDTLPELKFRALHALKFLADLLDVAKPAAFTAWRPVAFPGVDVKPAGLAIRCADGATVYLRATGGFGGLADADDVGDYQVPDSVRG